MAATGAVASVLTPWDWGSAAATPYTPVCAEGRVPVCVHPAYASWLREVSDAVNRVMEPLSGVPGAPVRAAQAVEVGTSVPTSRTLQLALDEGSHLPRSYLHQEVARRLAVGGYEAENERGEWAQEAIAMWLGDRANGVKPECGGDSAEEWMAACAAARRFAGLPEAAQKEWLRAHWTRLRAGKVRLEDLP
jgi:hypothetical protein